MDTPHKLNIKLPNGAEFTAEGNETTIRELFAQFLDVARTVPPPAVVSPTQPPAAAGAMTGGSVADTLPPPNTTPQSLQRELLDRLFAIDRAGDVSLRALPRGDEAEAEAVLVTLYGFNALRNEPTVGALRLMRSARRSGLQNIRLNRLMSRNHQYITESGSGRGKRYGLNNPGVRRAEDILRGILE